MIKSEQIVGVLSKLEKYRNEIIRVLMLFILVCILVYYKSDYAIKILAKPLNNQRLFFLTPVDGIMVRVKIAFLGGIIISLPFVLYRIISLLPSKVTKKTRRIIYFLLLPFVIVSFIGGVVFAYYLVLPTTIQFLLGCGNEFMKPTISGSDYFSFVTILLLVIGIIFELPIILVALSSIGIVSYKMLSSKRRVAILIIVIIVAIITPTPDAFTLTVVSIPMVALYEISIWWIFLLEKKRRKASMDITV